MFSRVLVGDDGRSGGRDAAALAEQLADPRTHPELAHVHPPVGSELHRVALSRSVDLLVVGSASHPLAGVVLPSDHARAALNGAPCAVAIAPMGYATHPGQIATIGVADNGSPESTTALAAARELAARDGLTITALSVVDLPSLEPTPSPPTPRFARDSTRSGTVSQQKASRARPSTAMSARRSSSSASTSICCSSAPAATGRWAAFSSGVRPTTWRATPAARCWCCHELGMKSGRVKRPAVPANAIMRIRASRIVHHARTRAGFTATLFIEPGAQRRLRANRGQSVGAVSAYRLHPGGGGSRVRPLARERDLERLGV